MVATATHRDLLAEPEDDLSAGSVVVGESGRFEGLLTFRGRARIDGELIGEIVCRGTLRLGEMARVNAVIEGRHGATSSSDATALARKSFK